MGLETGTYINSLNAANPLGTDPKSAGDDHIRLLKATIKATFPNVTGAVTVTQAELNRLAGVTSNIQTQLNANQAAIATFTPALGSGQTWQAVSPIPASDTSVQNTSGRTIAAAIYMAAAGRGVSYLHIQVSADNATWFTVWSNNDPASNGGVHAGIVIVPAGHYYKYMGTWAADSVTELTV